MVQATGLDLHFSFSNEKEKYRKNPVCALGSATCHRQVAYKWVRVLHHTNKRGRPLGLPLLLPKSNQTEQNRGKSKKKYT